MLNFTFIRCSLLYYLLAHVEEYGSEPIFIIVLFL